MFPNEIWAQIYLYDNTYREILEKVLENDLMILECEEPIPYWFIHANGIHERCSTGVWLISVDRQIWKSNENFTWLSEQFFKDRQFKYEFLKKYNVRKITHNVKCCLFLKWYSNHLCLGIN